MAEVFVAIEAAGVGRLHVAKLAIATAWRTGMYSRVKKLPGLKLVLDEFDEMNRQADEPVDQTAIDRGVAARKAEMERLARKGVR